jgi:site-specific DNA-adenine methylase
MISPIKDLRHNTKSLSILKEIIPAGSNVESFLLFAGDVEINLAESERIVIAHTNRYVIYDFWKTLFDDSRSLAQSIEYLYPFKTEEVFRVFQNNYHKEKSPLMRAALFFLLNRCSSNGMISSGVLEQKNYNPLALNYIRRFKQINFDVAYDYSLSIEHSLNRTSAQTDFIFLPVGKFSYNLLSEGINRGPEETTIVHKKLKNIVDNISTKTILNYQYHPGVLKLFKDYESITMLDEYGKETTNKENAKEILIANFRTS